MKKIVMSGSTGFVGTHLKNLFEDKSWGVKGLFREDFNKKPVELAESIKGSNIIINLAGAPIISRWSEKYKEEMRRSRIELTGKIIEALKLLDKKPELFISTSAVGFYSTEGEHDEYAFKHADDFLGRLTDEWEREAIQAKVLAIRTVIFRFGIVLGKDGGALKQMVFPFKIGLGGTIGDGSQDFSWIHIRDLLRAYEEVISDSSFEGAYNLTSPNPTTNRGLSEALGHVFNKPVLLKIPEFLLRLRFGEGSTVLSQGQRALPKRLVEAGFGFEFPEIEEALKDLLT